MNAFPWAKILSMLMPILSLLLGGVAASNVQAIEYGVVDGTAGNWGVTGVAGLGSLLSLATGLFASWRSSGRVNPGRASELAAASLLAGTRAHYGDTEGSRLVANLSAHLVEYWKTVDGGPAVESVSELPTVAEIHAQFEARIRQDVARSIERVGA